MPLYVNLLFNGSESVETRLDFILEHGMAPELRLDSNALDKTPCEQHKFVSRRLARAGVRPSVHLPHEGMRPGARDEHVREATASRLTQAVELAKIYDAALMIGHANLLEDFTGQGPAGGLESSLRTWREVLAAWPGHPPLCLENVFEPAPEPLADLATALNHDRIGLCFDIGHWHSLARGAMRQDLDRWLDVLGPWIRHLHVHDNFGRDDEHLGPGMGRIDFYRFFQGLADRGVEPGVTFEPHSHDALLSCLAFADEHPQWLFKRTHKPSHLLAS